MATFAKSKRSVAKKLKLDPARPFAPEILRRAEKIARRYQVIVWFDEECGEYYGRGVELPTALGDGATPDDCVAHTREAFIAVIAFMLEEGQSPPPPAVGGLRTEQVNVRLSAEEKLALETAAQSQGYKGISDFVRAAALSVAR
jgi:predicted RNase H-like HicB family nuclease